MEFTTNSAVARCCFQEAAQATSVSDYRPATPTSRQAATQRLALLAGLLATLAATATLGYDVNDRLLWLRGRVQFAAAPGVLKITLSGMNRLGHVRFAPMETALRGRATDDAREDQQQQHERAPPLSVVRDEPAGDRCGCRARCGPLSDQRQSGQPGRRLRQGPAGPGTGPADGASAAR